MTLRSAPAEVHCRYGLNFGCYKCILEPRWMAEIGKSSMVSGNCFDSESNLRAVDSH